MGKHWVYILKNIDEYDNTINYYIGETVCLYKRLNQHLNGCGSINTFHFNNVSLVGLYNVNQNCNFIEYNSKVTAENLYKYGDFKINYFTFKKWKESLEGNYEYIQTNDLKLKQFKSEYDYHYFENYITEMCALLFPNCEVKGGKYTKYYVDYKDIYKNLDKNIMKERPICKCGLPAEVFLSKKNEIWFKCAISNTTWINFEHDLFNDISYPCNFIKKYLDDKFYQDEYKNSNNIQFNFKKEYKIEDFLTDEED